MEEPDGGNGADDGGGVGCCFRGRRKKMRARFVYGIALAMAYTLALALAMGMIFVFQTAQPALLYIVPLLNFAVISESNKRARREKELGTINKSRTHDTEAQSRTGR